MAGNDINWHIGCSGFSYRDWKENFYPKGLAQKNWFDYYATQFDSLELNVTFYRFPQLSFLQNWYNKAPAGFLFAVKAPRLITHYKQFKEVKELLNDFYTTTKDGLEEKLGAVLFQLPPKFVYTPEALELIITQLDNSVHNVLEFRHPSWWNKEVYTILKQANITFCSHSYPNLPDEVVSTNGVVYYRFHGVPKLYYSEYSENFLNNIISSIQKKKTNTKAFLLFNNTATMAAINNARYIKNILGLSQ